MENGNSFLIKIGLGTLILALGLNIYRTETIKKQMDNLSLKEETIHDTSSNQIDAFSKSIADLESRVTGLQKSLNDLAVSHKSVSSSTPSVKLSTAPTLTKTNSSPSDRIFVSAKAKAENRYVDGKLYTPNVTTGQSGHVEIGITLNNLGWVTKASVNSTSITDEDIIDLCKECALKTRFSRNFDAPNRTYGIITYTFSSK